MKLDTLEISRQKLNLKFAKGCLKIDKLCSMFPIPLNEIQHNMDRRSIEKFKFQGVQICSKYKRIIVPIFTNLLCYVFSKNNILPKIFFCAYFCNFFSAKCLIMISYSLPKLTLTKNNTFKGF